MQCVISGSTIKPLNKAVETLAKISDEIQLICQPKTVSFAAMNDTKTVIGKFTFDCAYFMDYKINIPDNKQSMDCRLYSQSMQTIFKAKMFKKIDFIELRLDGDGDRIHVHFKYKSDITLIHRFKLLESEPFTLDTSAEIRLSSNTLRTMPAHLSIMLNNFQPSTAQVYWEIDKDMLLLRNHNRLQKFRKGALHSLVKVSMREFPECHIDEPTSFVMACKPLRALLAFTDQFDLGAWFYFRNGGRPVVVRCTDTLYSMDFMLSTLNVPVPQNALMGNITLTQASSGELSAPMETQTQTPPRLTAELFNTTSPSVDADETQRSAGAKRLRFDPAMDTLTVRSYVSDDEDDDSLNGTKDMEGFNPYDTPLAHVFARCLNATQRQSQIDYGEVLAPPSDEDD